MACFPQVQDLPPVPVEEIRAHAQGDTTQELHLAACWGYQQAIRDLTEVVTGVKP